MNTVSSDAVAHIYARQSLDVEVGIDRQLERCRQLIEARGWRLGQTYTDNDTSAAKTRGPGTAWAKMLREIRPDEVVVSVDLDRLLRSTRDLIAITDTGARVLTVDGEIDLTTADGEFRATMLAGIARFEVRRKSERQRRANEDRRAKGKPTPARRRYGYETDGVTPRESEAVHVRRIFEHLAAGGSLRSLSQAFIAEGIDPAPGTGWPVGRIRYIANNPRYSGFTPHNGDLIPSTVTPIVSEELGEQVRAILADPTRRTTPGPSYKHLLSGLVHCNLCGDYMFYMRSYRCHTSNAHVSINKDILEPFVLDEIAKAFIVGGPDLFPAQPGTVNIAELMAAHTRNTQAVADTLADRDEGLIPAPLARARLLELKAARESIEAELEAARNDKSAAAALLEIAQELIVHETVSMSDFESMKARVLERFHELDLERQRIIVTALVHVEVAKGREVSKRVFVTHKLVPSLNADYLDARDFVE